MQKYGSKFEVSQQLLYNGKCSHKKVTKLVKHVKVPSFHTICGPNVSVACAGQRLEIGHKYFAIWTLSCCKITLP